MERKATIKYQCKHCDEVHDDEDDAYDCCRPSIRTVYACPVCDETHYAEKEALACCEDQPEPEPLYFNIPQGISDPSVYIKTFDEINGLVHLS